MGLSLRNALTAAACFTTAILAAPPPAYGHGKLPKVDLGYEIHQAALFNETGRYYNFSNIRYAAPREWPSAWFRRLK